MDERFAAARILGDRNYLQVILAGTLIMAINFVLLAYVPVLVVAQGYSTFLAGFQNTIFAVASVGLRFYLGPLTDVRGSKAVMLVGAGGFTAGSALFVFAGGAYSLIVAARLLSAVGMAAYLSAASCYISEISTPVTRGIAIGVQRAGYSIALMMGPPAMARAIGGAGGFRAGFTGLFVAGVVALFLLLLVRDTGRRSEGSFDGVRETAKILQSPPHRQICSMILVAGVGFGSILSYATLYLSGVPSFANPGLYLSLFAVGGLIGNVTSGILMSRLNLQKLALSYALMLSAGTALLFLVPAAPLPAALASGLLAGCAFPSLVSVAVNWLIRVTPAESRGTAMGLQESSIDSGIAAGSLVYGLLSFAMLPQTSFLAIGVAAIPVYLFVYFRAVRRDP